MDNFDQQPKEDELNSVEQNAQESSSSLKPRITPVRAGLLGLGGGFFLYQIFGGMLSLAIFGVNLEDAPQTPFRLMQIASQILFILLPALIFSKLIYEDVTTVIRFRFPTLKEIGIFLIGILLLTSLLQEFLNLQNFYFEQLAASSSLIKSLKDWFDSINKMLEGAYGKLLAVNNFADGFLVVIVIAVTPAICEEIMFRGFIQTSFELKWKKFGGALVTAIFFGVYHFNPYALFPLIILGLYFGYAAYKSNSIFVPMVLHFVNNFAAVMMFFILGDSELLQNKVIPAEEIGRSWLSFGFQSVLFLVLIFFINRYYKNKEKVNDAVLS